MAVNLLASSDHAEQLAHALVTGDWGEGLRRASVRDGAQIGELLVRQDYVAVWPRLKVISCWDSAFAKGDAGRLRRIFPSVRKARCGGDVAYADV